MITEMKESPVEVAPTDVPDLEWLNKGVDSLARLAAHLFGIQTEFRTLVVGPFGALVMTGPTDEERRHALTHRVAVGWAKVQPMEGCRRCFPQTSPPSTHTSDGSPRIDETDGGEQS